MFRYKVDEETEICLLEERHTEALFYLTDENRAYLRQWIMWADDIQSMTDSRQFIRQGLRQYADNDGFQAGIWYRGELSGCIGIHSINWFNRNTEIGYWLSEDVTGKGLMTRACRAVIDHAFGVWNLHRVVIRCAEGNLKSRAIPERLGFQIDGIMREEVYVQGRYLDHVVYSMLSSDWRRLN